MPARPGQRAGQRPQRAAIAAQRALGRAARDGGGLSTAMTVRIEGRWWRVSYDEKGRSWWECRETGARCTGGPCTDKEE
jgi:hypothetical protein